jgi:hypothetical protein
MTILITLLLILFQTACPVFSPCQESLANEAKSPDGRFVAVWALRNCGATTNYSSIVRVNPSNDPHNKAGEVFVVNGDRDIRLVWKDNSALRVLCNKCEANQIFRKSESASGVSILYE